MIADAMYGGKNCIRYRGRTPITYPKKVPESDAIYKARGKAIRYDEGWDNKVDEMNKVGRPQVLTRHDGLYRNNQIAAGHIIS